jgi:hypothetical protein
MSIELAEQNNSLAAGKVDTLLREMSVMPQVDCPVQHFFGPSIYIREITIPAGTVIVGKYHKEDHLCSMVEGRMIVMGEDGVQREVAAPAVFMAKKGRKTAYAIETVRFQNIYSTNETDVEKLEHMLVEDSPALLKQGE